MSGAIRPCSVCSLPSDVLAAVNDALAKKEKLRTIESRIHISRSSLSRHSRKCLTKGPGWTPASIHADLLSGRKRPRIIWPGENPQLTDADIPVLVQFEKPLPPRILKPPVMPEPEPNPADSD